MENSTSNPNSNSNNKQQRNKNRMMVLEGGVVGLSIVSAMNNITNNIVSSAKAAANFRGTTTTNGLFFASTTLNKIEATNFVPPTSYFLSSCNLCNKHLHGVDIFIYRGEKAFCSAECRETHIINDDYQEKFRSRGLMKPLHSMPPYPRPPLSYAGIAAA